tara:strand:- start:49 stop:495 length:447 start_codon:yes stop_codon:yes gene_type:complete
MAISHIPRSVGHNFAPEYQISAVPYNKTSANTTSLVVLTNTGAIVPGGDAGDPDKTAIKRLDFPKITQWLQFKATGAIKVFFSRKDAAANNNNCINLSANETTYPLNLRCTSLYFVSNPVDNLQIRAGLTSIESSEFTEVVETFLGDS